MSVTQRSAGEQAHRLEKPQPVREHIEKLCQWIEYFQQHLGPGEIAPNGPAMGAVRDAKEAIAGIVVSSCLPAWREKLTEHDWLQIRMAAAGTVSGTSDEWPDLVVAISKVRGQPQPRRSAQWLRGFCEALVAASEE